MGVFLIKPNVHELGHIAGMGIRDEEHHVEVAREFVVAAGSAIVTTPGTELCREGDVARLYQRMSATSSWRLSGIGFASCTKEATIGRDLRRAHTPGCTHTRRLATA